MLNLNPIKTRSAFSLIEVMVGMLITIVLITSVYSIFILSQKIQRRIDDRAEVVQNERAIMDRLARELRQTNKVATSLPASEILFEDGHQNLENVPIQYVRYHLVGTDMYREIRYYYFASAPSVHVYYDDKDNNHNPPSMSVTEDRLIGQYVTSLNFLNNNGTISIAITFSQNNQTITLTNYVSPRNLELEHEHE